MPKFNVIVTNWDRDEYCSKCISYLDKANEGRADSVIVYLISDKHYDPPYTKNIKVVQIKAEQEEDKFCKAALINMGMKKMRKRYDYFVQLDCDLLVDEDVFTKIAQASMDWLVLGGVKLVKDFTDFILYGDEKSGEQEIDPESIALNDRRGYVGNVAVKRECIKDVLQAVSREELYDEKFKGWGGEDSQLSMLTSAMKQRGIISKDYLSNAWMHLWHEPSNNAAYLKSNQYAANVRHLNSSLMVYQRRILSWGR